ncbi:MULTISPECIES: helix-turn-helix transcriptional regulator [Photorhabdus]|uniref:Regulatory LuxR family protein n=2 Tax=Photorhabdus asymbiotica TaxID=291112 RepID=A0ABX9SIL4_9GAMM|nr:helix-turn-helix transcriptional regulator [Photorhabdus asymbiotica]RKS56962.1 regulatory LuxR family protein [Photorhabdus asymbiotica]CAQ84680.1 similar to probable transcriptional regulator [Photorhabdus asymbiotica]
MSRSGCKKVPFITPQLTNMWDKSSEPWSVKDKEFRFIYANTMFIKTNKLPENFNVIGYTDRELPTPVNQFAHLFEEHDRKVLQCMQRISSLNTHPQSKNEQSISYYLCNKYPLMDENKQCIGIISHAREIHNFTASHYIENDIPISIRFQPPSNILKEKEWIVIFLFCRGVNNRCIAREMKISYRTVEKYFENIYEKLSVNSAIELRIFCKENNYDLYIPPKYFQSIGHILLYPMDFKMPRDDQGA